MTENIKTDLLVPFENHPFKKRGGIDQQELLESIAKKGMLEPITVRSLPDTQTQNYTADTRKGVSVEYITKTA